MATTTSAGDTTRQGPKRRLTATNTAAMNSARAAALSGDQINALSANAFAGFKTTQISALTINAIAGLSAATLSEMSKAADRIESVGGDETVAQLEERCRTVLLQIEDGAQRYLRLPSLAAKLVAERMTDEIVRQVEGAFDALVEACRSGDVHKVNDADFALHRTIIAAVGSARLSAQYRQVEQQVRFYLIWSNELVGTDLQAIVAQHEPAIEALLSRDPIRAAKEAYRHNESEGGQLTAVIRRQRKAECAC